MTVNDLFEQFEIHGAMRVQRWDDETNDMEVMNVLTLTWKCN